MQKCRALDDSAVPPLLDGADSLEFLNLTDCQLLHTPLLVSERLLALSTATGSRENQSATKSSKGCMRGHISDSCEQR